MPERPSSFSIRSFREGDEAALAGLFNRYMEGFFGPVRVTPTTWREQFRAQSWTGPSLDIDRDCVRIVEREGRVVGYAVTDYEPHSSSDGAVVQELCLADDDVDDDVVEALLADAERRALERGRCFIEVALSLEDGRAAEAVAGRGYHVHSGSGSVFMAAILDLGRLLAEIRGELRQRLDQSTSRDWAGSLRIAAGGSRCVLRVSPGDVAVGSSEEEADISATIDPEMLPLLLLGRVSTGELHTQGKLTVSAVSREEALALLTALFPRLPGCLPRAQWW